MRGGALVTTVLALTLAAPASADPGGSRQRALQQGLISAAPLHSCAILDDSGDLRCWGSGALGRLGYGNTDSIGDDETPDAAGPVDVGAGRTAVQIVGGGARTCALLG